MYKISIIVPVFNVEDTLQNAFDSIKSQTIGFENLEVIFIDDKSTDNSRKIIEDFSRHHTNVKSFYLDENSGFAGKPRNIGIENATADYIMFLDSDDIFLDHACEILYKNITENDLDIISGNYNINRDKKITKNNWNILKLDDNESIEVHSIDENFNLLLPPPSVWSKIFKREFLLKENLRFLEGVPAQDLVFVSQGLLKANGIMFINTPVVEYIPRQSGEKSVTSKKTKGVLSGFIKSYTELYNIAKDYNPEYSWIGPRNLSFWIKQFTLSNLPINDKVDLLHIANPLFEEYITTDKIKHPEFLKEFLNLIEKKDYINASRLSKKLDIYYDDKILIEKIKEKEIFLLFYGLDIEIGGLAKATFTRANLLKKHNYNVTLLNLNKLKNFEFIIENFHKTSYLDESIDIINIIEYYANKNTLDTSAKPIIKEETNHFREINETNDKTTVINYYNNPQKENIIKSESYFNRYYCITTFDDNQPIQEEYFTNDGFNYLNIFNDELYILKDRKGNLKLEFKHIYGFHDHFITEILLKYKNKSFLINENSGRIPNFSNIDSRIAYKIASIHTNPYIGEHHYGSSLRKNYAILEDLDELDYMVVLTEGLKSDLIKELNIKNITAIPNIINTSKYLTDNKSSKNNKFSIFARISPEKNISDAIKAIKLVTKERNDVILEIYGRAATSEEREEKEKLKSLVDEMNLKDNVVFKGHIKDVNEKMSESLATLFTSNFEGLGMVVLESMLNSTPVISYDLYYGPSDFIIDGENGYLVEQGNINELANCILTLLKNPSKAYEMGELAQKQILKQIDLEILFLKWENIFKEVYINSKQETPIDENILNKLKDNERLKIRLYKEIDKLYIQNRLLKREIESNDKNNVKNIFKKLKILK